MSVGNSPTDCGTDFKCFILYWGVLHFDAEHLKRLVSFLHSWQVLPMVLFLLSLMGRDSLFVTFFKQFMQVTEDIVQSQHDFELNWRKLINSWQTSAVINETSYNKTKSLKLSNTRLLKLTRGENTTQEIFSQGAKYLACCSESLKIIINYKK